MPGTGQAEVMFMRFQVQAFDHTTRWHNLAGADSGFVELGSGRASGRQSGNTFTITPPRAGAAPYLLRGVVSFEWRRGRHGRAAPRRSTTAGASQHRGLRPRRLLRRTCSIT